jgi:pseudaminic acid synthase
MARSEIRIGKQKIGENHPTFIVAELSCNHLQHYDLAEKTIESMAKSGANAVKLQAYTPESITLNSNSRDFLRPLEGTLWEGKNLHELYGNAYTPREWFAPLKEKANKLGMEFFSSAFSKVEIDFLERVGVPAHKIASYEITDTPLIGYAASKGRPMIIATGLATENDLEKAIQACESQVNDELILLKCTSAYPTPNEEANLRTIPDLASRYGVIAGLSDHTRGIVAPIVSVALGADIIEKHFILDRELKYPNGEYSFDREFSLEPSEFSEMVKGIRTAEEVLGKVTYELSISQKKSRELSPSLYIVKDVCAGEEFTERNLRSIRPSYGMHPENLPNILGKRATRD